jgi:hypothetical protein
VLGADACRDFFRRSQPRDLIADLEGVFRECGWLHGHTEFFATGEGTQIFGFGFRDWNDDAVVGEERFQVDARGRERFLVGFVADREVVGEEHHPRGVGVGKVNRALIAERHGPPRNTRNTRKGAEKTEELANDANHRNGSD